MCAEHKMSARSLYVLLRFARMLRQTAEVSLSKEIIFLNSYIFKSFPACFEVFFSSLVPWKAGGVKGKWRENVDRILYCSECGARWKIVIGG